MRDWIKPAIIAAAALGGLWLYATLHTPDVFDLYERAWQVGKGGPAEAEFYRANAGKKVKGTGRCIGYKRLDDRTVLFAVEHRRGGTYGSAVLEYAGPSEPFRVGDTISFRAVISECDLNGNPTWLPKVAEFSKD